MNKELLFDLLSKFKKGNCSKEEEVILYQYFNSLQNTDKTLDWSFKEKNEARIRILKRISTTIRDNERGKRKKLDWRGVTAVAVIFLIFLIISSKIVQNNGIKEELLNNEITLELEDGSIEVLKKNAEINIYDSQGRVIGKQKGTKLAYKKNLEANRLIYNILTVPYGEFFVLQLSDGSIVQLNSGTKIKYPNQFLEGMERKVFITGEAFFDVAKDDKAPFIVNIDDLDVKVLGTKFNVNAYPEELKKEVVLVEGLVDLYLESQPYNKETSFSLKPGYKAVFNDFTSEITKTKVSTEIYTAWLNGELVFRNMSFDNILKNLERHYNVKIINLNNNLHQQKFHASFGKKPPLQMVLDELKEIYKIDYTINKNTITIN
ncbi:FecR family protein [Pseudotamlana agarivorans]|uniref:FecR family protein n=1 Tax=Pseudotamlana agarivorans TaxID=481183 RepID=UPI00082CFC6B|nr:FecR family protein [Tamlana agarivorans]